MAAPINVLVVGAGPVGLLTTLRLARAGISVTCLETLPAIDSSPRAMAYHPIAVRELDRAGVLGDCRRIGAQGRGICWRNTRTKEVIAELNRAPNDKEPYENLIIGQHLLAGIIVEHLKRYENARVEYGRKVVAVEQDGEGVRLTVEGGEGRTKVMTATYCIAADGGRSTMRRLLDISFDGFTYEDQLVSTNVYFDFEAHGWIDANFMVDPEHWALIARINDRGLWRVSYGEKPGLSPEQIKERMPWKYAQMFPANAEGYRLEQMNPYRLNQRCASTFRKGRVVLAGDAAHLCNPFGGLGLTGGILDAGAVADALVGIHEGKTSDAILDKYAEVRRRIFVDTVDPTSQKNKERLHDDHPETLGDRDSFLHMLRTADVDDLQKVRGNAQLAIDMSGFFDNSKTTSENVSGGRAEEENQQSICPQAHAPPAAMV